MKSSKKDSIIQNKLKNLDWGSPPLSVITQAKELACAKKPPRYAWLKTAASAAACVFVVFAALWTGNAFAPINPFDKTGLRTFGIESFNYDYQTASEAAKDHGVLFFGQSVVSSVEMMDYDKAGQILTYAVTSGGDSIVVTAKLNEINADLFNALSTPLVIQGVRINYSQKKDGNGMLFTASFVHKQNNYTVSVKTDTFEKFVYYLESLLN